MQQGSSKGLGSMETLQIENNNTKAHIVAFNAKIQSLINEIKDLTRQLLSAHATENECMAFIGSLICSSLVSVFLCPPVSLTPPYLFVLSFVPLLL